MANPTQLFYIHVPTERRDVEVPIEFLSVSDFTSDEPACRAVWDMMSANFHTRGKFLAIWPSVRHVALHRHEGQVVGCLFVSTPVNWQVDYVMVRSDMRHRGISAALVNETVNQALARNVPYVMLTSKPELRPLYEGRCGFQVAARSAAENTPVKRFPLSPALNEVVPGSLSVG